MYGLCTTAGIIFEYHDDANDDDADDDDVDDNDDDDGDDDGDNDESYNNDNDNNDDEENDDNDDDNNDDDDENDDNDDDEAAHNACSRRISCATQECFNNDSPNVLTLSYCVTLHPKLRGPWYSTFNSMSLLQPSNGSDKLIRIMCTSTFS